MSYIKRKRDRRDYQAWRALVHYATQPLRIMTGLTEPPHKWKPDHSRIWHIPETQAAPNRAAFPLSGEKS